MVPHMPRPLIFPGSIIKAVNRWAPVDNDVAVFGRVLRSEVRPGGWLRLPWMDRQGGGEVQGHQHQQQQQQQQQQQLSSSSTCACPCWRAGRSTRSTCR